MAFEPHNDATEAFDGQEIWREHEKRILDLVTAIWPSTPLIELPRKISLQKLRAKIDSGSLSTEHEERLKDYLISLPGYGVPGFEEETERHHGFLTAHLNRLGARTDQVSFADQQG